MRRLGAIAALVVLATALAAPRATEPASLTLSERQIEEAVEAGERSVTQDDLSNEWRVRNAAGDALMVMTPFHRLALAARHAAFRNEPLKPRDRTRLLKEQHDRLVFWVELKGPRDDFARFFTPRLIVGARHIEPSFTQNERTAAPVEDGKYLAKCVYGFSTRHVDGKSKVVLVVRDGDGRDRSTFSFDLSTMR